ncbi:hypothetical protein, partial [Brachyspira hampsonii]|uniref:hypothetical protein n=1 Tax=Brachyspira hampsonii TaxID=1287055 RepID=UPI0015E78753
LNLEETKNLFTVDNILDNDALTNYIFTNKAITNYSYGFKIGYYSKIFKHSDLYGVYPNTNKIITDNNFIKEIKMNEGGSPFGYLISEKKLLYYDKIDNVNYILKLKYNLLLVFFIFTLILILFLIRSTIKKILSHNIFNIYGIVLIFFIVFIFIFYLLGNISHKGYLSNLELIYKSSKGYIYKAKLNSKGIFSPNLIYKYSSSPLILKDKPDYIKNYGYSLEITNAPSNFSNNLLAINKNYDGTFNISNINVSLYPHDYWVMYDYKINPSPGELYKVSTDIKVYSMDSNSVISYSFDYLNKFPLIFSESISESNIVYSSTNYIYYALEGNANFYMYFPGRNINIDLKSILIEQINNDLYLKDNNEIIFTSYKEIIEDELFKNINYKLTILNIYIYVLYVLLILYAVFYSIKYQDIIRNIFNKRTFLFSSALILLIFFIFQYWLSFPGIFTDPDSLGIMYAGFSKNFYTWHPPLIQLFLSILYELFGYHTSYLLTVNLLLWYIGLYLIIIGIYIKFNNPIIILLSLISFIANTFLVNINQMKDITAALYLWFAYSLLFFTILVPIRNKKIYIVLNIFAVIMLVIGMLWRYNLIFAVYPMLIIIAYNISKKYSALNIKKFLFGFSALMIIFAFSLIIIAKTIPAFISKDKSYPATHIFLMQIAACAVQANDDSLIPEDWYMDGKSFEDVKEIYKDNKTFADPYGAPWDVNRLFKGGNVKDLKKVWISYILKYPMNYMKYIRNMYDGYLKQGTWKFIGSSMKLDSWKMSQEHFLYNFKDGYEIEMTPIKGKIYSYLYDNLPDFNITIFVIILIVLFIISGFLWLIKKDFRNNILLFVFCSSFSGFAAFCIVVSFTPIVTSRYIHPIIDISILSLISFVTFICDRGGFNKFIQELCGKK